MLRAAVLIALLGVLVTDSAAQDASATALPHVSLILPAGVSSENVQIDYYMTGPFGGYGGFVRPEKQRKGYEIEASVEGRAADVLKVIAYLPGCEIVILMIPVKGEEWNHQLRCKKIPSIALRGEIFPLSLTQEQPAEVEVYYVAPWSHDFFGLKDGSVTTFRLGRTNPDRDGKFKINLPALSPRLGRHDGYYALRLQNGNMVAYLRPENSERNELPIQPSYPAEIRFLAER